MQPLLHHGRKSDKITVLFDAVVTHYRLDNENIGDPKHITVSAKMNFKNVNITSSRINVTEFNPSSSVEMKTTIKQLRKNVETYGMYINVKLQGCIVGAGILLFPSDVTDRICEDMHDVIHSGVVNLAIGGNQVGEVEMLCQLTLKCEETKAPISGEPTDCQSNWNESINSKDIMFVMGSTCPISTDACQDILLPDDGDKLLQLDLLRYQQIKFPPTNTDMLMHNPAVNAAIYKLKQMSRKCAEIVDSVTSRLSEYKPKTQAGKVQTDVETAPDSSYGRSYSYIPVCSPAKVDNYESFKSPIPRNCFKPLDKPIRFCPICLTSMSWLPKFAACPMCGVNPVPVIAEHHMNTNFAADQILIDCLDKSKEW